MPTITDPLDMSPPSQNLSPASRGMHNRNVSGHGHPKPETKAAKRPPTLTPEIHFTAFIRLPFPRGDFVDPPPVEWDATKDRALWKIISRSPRTSDLNWEELATKFQVPPTFMLQQAAWLYQRHLSHVRAQMRKVGSASAASGSGGMHTPTGSVPMKRLGSGGPSRPVSAMSMRARESPLPKAESSVPGTPRATAPPLSRTPSTRTVTQSRAVLEPSHPRATSQRSFRSSFPSARKPESAPERAEEESRAEMPSPPSPVASAESTSTSDSDSDVVVFPRSQVLKRPPRRKAPKSPLARLAGEGDDEDDDEEGTFLPFAQTERLAPQDLSATVRENVEKAGSSSGPEASKRPPARGKQRAVESSASSASSAAAIGPQGDANRAPRPPGPLSPRHRAEFLERLSPRLRGARREGSEETPSMGSSFSDLEDTSITQSALEEALLSNMQHGGMSRISNFSQAFRSRYM